jgi:hypothetical protein
MSADPSNEQDGLHPPARDDDARADIDLTARKPLRLGVVYGDTVWLNNAPREVVRVRVDDLRGLADRVRAVRQDQPGCDVVVDIEVVLADEARQARAALATVGDPPEHGSLRYVGTPTGLAGLVADVYALGLSDGAILIPLLGGATPVLIRDVVLPELASFLPDTLELQQSRPA